MRIRPGRTRSLLAGIMALVVTAAGLLMMGSFTGAGDIPPAFIVVWVVFGLGGAAAAFYNAFSRRGLPLYEVDVETDEADSDLFCPQCGEPVDAEDRFCRHCSAPLR